MIITDPQTIIDFLRGIIPDYKGRMHEDLIRFSDVEMERCHDQCQWLFPLHEESKFADTYPIITKEVVELSEEYPEVNSNIMKASRRMRLFLGIRPFDNIERQRDWLEDGNHNLLRVTRVIRCLRLFNMVEQAVGFYNDVYSTSLYFDISPMTYDYWSKALMTEDQWSSLQS